MAKCPSHEDSSPSLSVTEKGGKLLMKCFAGCTFQQVRDALAARGIDLGSQKVQEGEHAMWDHAPGQETVYVIKDAAGTALAEHVRVDRPGGKTFFWRGPNGSKATLKELGIAVEDLPLYGAETLAGAPPATPVFLCEGEKSAECLRALGVIALATVCGASATPSPAVLQSVAGRRVYLWPDNDQPGQSHMTRIASRLKPLGCEPLVIDWKASPPKGDAADWLASGGDRDGLKSLAAQARARGVAVPGLRLLWEGVDDALRHLNKFEAGDFSDRVATGISTLDQRLLGGLRPGTMVLLGGPSGSGKTTIVQQIASAASRNGGGVLLVTPEMDLEELAEREIIRRSGHSKAERAPWLRVNHETAQQAHERAAMELDSERPRIYVLDRNEASMDDIESAAGSIDNLRLVIIDYAQQVAGDPDARTPRYLQVGEVGLRSIDIARKFRVPVLVASQVNVQKEGRQRTYTFRETAILEHKANTVLVFEVDWEDDDARPGARRPKSARFECTKHRGGAPFSLEVDFDSRLYRVKDLRDERSSRSPYKD